MLQEYLLLHFFIFSSSILISIYTLIEQLSGLLETQWIKMFVIDPNDLSSFPRTRIA